MYHQNKFQVCISKNNERRAKNPSLTIYLNMRGGQTDKQTDKQTNRQTDRQTFKGRVEH